MDEQQRISGILESFEYQKPDAEQTERIISVRSMFKSAASMVLEKTKPSRDQSLAITYLEEAMMRATRAIIFEEKK